MTLPSYEEAVYGCSGLQESSGPPPSPPPPPGPSESRVPIVFSEGPPRGAAGGQGPSRTRHHRDLDFCLPSTSSQHHAETVLVHQAPSSSSSSWAREHPGGACAAPLPLRRDSDSSDQHSLLSVTSTDEFSDGKKTLCSYNNLPIESHSYRNIGYRQEYLSTDTNELSEHSPYLYIF